MGELRLQLRPPGLLFIDGAEIGERTSYRDSLPAGEHVIQVRREGFAQVDSSIMIVAGEALRISLTTRRN